MSSRALGLLGGRAMALMQQATSPALSQLHPTCSCNQAARYCSLMQDQFSLRIAMLHSFASSLEKIEVTVPSMGDSITEGTIAAVLKKEGEAVEEDETIVQIETDKVTVDVRAPKAGVLASVQVKEEDTVAVGQMVACVETDAEASAGSQEAAKQPSEAKEQKEGQQQQQASQKPAEPQGQEQQQQQQDTDEQQHGGRKPMIKFPRRRTDKGERISNLAEQERQKWLGQHDAGHAQPDKAADRGTTKTAAQKQAQKPAQPGFQGLRYKWYPGKEQGTKLSAARVLSEREMEIIELGGAD